MTFSITTSRRIGLFSRTIDSLTSCCVDLHFSRAVLLDDGSNTPDLNWMRTVLETKLACPVISSHVDFPMGRTASMKRWFKLVQDDYCFHIEDDWEFIRGFSLVELTNLIKNTETIGQIALTRSGQEHGATDLGGFWIWHRPDRYPHYTSNPHLVKMVAIHKVGDFEPAATALDTQPTDEFCYGLRWMHHGFHTAYSWEKIAKHIGGGQSAYTLNHTKR
jgi:hypothetical protein